MSITITQFNMLANKYNFNVDEARAFIGLPVSSKRGRPSKSQYVCVGGNCSDCSSDDEIQTKKADKTVAKAVKADKDDKDDKKKRGPSGYNLFMSENRTKIAEKLKKASKGDKLEKGALFSAVGSQWKALSDKDKAKWNTKAANM